MGIEERGFGRGVGDENWGRALGKGVEEMGVGRDLRKEGNGNKGNEL